MPKTPDREMASERPVSLDDIESSISKASSTTTRLHRRVFHATVFLVAALVLAAGAVYVLQWQDILEEKHLKIWKKESYQYWILPAAAVAYVFLIFAMLSRMLAPKSSRSTSTPLTSPAAEVPNDESVAKVSVPMVKTIEGSHENANREDRAQTQADVEDLRQIITSLQDEKNLIARQVASLRQELHNFVSSSRKMFKENRHKAAVDGVDKTEGSVAFHDGGGDLERGGPAHVSSSSSSTTRGDPENHVERRLARSLRARAAEREKQEIAHDSDNLKEPVLRRKRNIASQHRFLNQDSEDVMDDAIRSGVLTSWPQ